MLVSAIQVLLEAVSTKIANLAPNPSTPRDHHQDDQGTPIILEYTILFDPYALYGAQIIPICPDFVSISTQKFSYP